MQINIIKHNDVFLKIHAEKSVLNELSNYFSFRVPGYQFQPNYRNRLWNGFIYLFNNNTHQIYIGLYDKIVEFCQKSHYTISEDSYKPTQNLVSKESIESYIKDTLQPASKGVKLDVREYQSSVVHHCITEGRATILSPTSCHIKGDTVLMSTGRFKNIEDITTDDFVIGNDGKHKKVLRIFSGENVELYDIIPKRSKNNKITVTGEHILPLKFSDYNTKYGYAKGDKDYIEYITVSEYLKKPKFYKHCANIFYNSNILHFDNEIDPKINLSPYFIGCYIGDGSSYKCAITSIDKEIIDEIYAQANKFGCIVKHSASDKYAYKIVGSTNKENFIFREFKKVGLYFSGKNRIKCGDRFIPFELINSSENFRLELLAGLIDTDGYYSNNANYEYSSKSLRLCEDVKLLAISLGFKTTVSSKLNKKYNRLYYTTRISGDLATIPVRIPRKKHVQQVRQVIRSTYNKKFDVEFNSIDNFYGIEVEDHLYITNDGLITHNSGKSLMIYSLVRYLLDNDMAKRVLFIFPTVGLVSQMVGDFLDYSSITGWDVKTRSHMIFSGQEKISEHPLVFSTYQSLTKLPPKYFNSFDCIICDEVHTATAKSIKDIMEKSSEVSLKYGFTGTLSESKCHKLVVEGLFGTSYTATTTHNLMENNEISNLKIKCLVLKYKPEICKIVSQAEYAQEIDYITTNINRIHFIRKLASSLKNNTLILFTRIAHGKLIMKSLEGRENVHYIDGSNTPEERERVRTIAETTTDCVIIASYGIFSTGVNIRRLNNIIFASPYRSAVKVRQSLGRCLRLCEGKTGAVLYDIADDFTFKGDSNITMRHLEERIEMYKKDQLEYKLIDYNI